ncbi:hypothetical protein D4740_03125 [Actinomyces sp. 2119]|uniref:FtsK gamma domain-containing protein n=1 Tax=Actinomyces lilanjuaniae TaxID=2321394 RepID=A0ABN5PU58_9ACTO|nr:MULTISPECIES: hypothetical protein [Actinomyces]AYD90592.1 hypothetical protein D5R93_12370 [Actinomyces lilanjuaniae]RJF43953.1 hypothetical protein D4740_03125 [Actinomyces sp. 2119]
MSARGDRDAFLTFFAQGLAAAATATREQMLALARVQEDLVEEVRASSLSSAHAVDLVGLAVANPSFTVRTVQAEFGLSYGRANTLVGQLVDLGLLQLVSPGTHPRRFTAPRVLQVLLAGSPTQRSV